MKKAKLYHPDSHPPEKRQEFEEKFKKVNEAYRILSKETQKTKKAAGPENKFNYKASMYQHDVEFIRRQKDYYDRKQREAEENGNDDPSKSRWSTNPKFDRVVNPYRGGPNSSWYEWLKSKAMDPEGFIFYTFVFISFITYYNTMKGKNMRIGKFSEEEEDRYVEALNKENEKMRRRKLTPAECRAYSIDDLSNMERNGMVELPKAYQEIVEEHREMYDSSEKFEKEVKERRKAMKKIREKEEQKMQKVREKLLKEGGYEVVREPKRAKESF